MTGTQNRRSFFKKLGISGLGLAGLSSFSPLKAEQTLNSGKKLKFELGVASYGLRGLSFDDLLAAMQVIGIKNLSLKSMHLPFELEPTEIKRRMEILRSAGLNPYAPGVVYMKSEQEVIDRFKYTSLAGMNMIVGVPDYELLDLVENQVKETGIKLAIHCHGPDNMPYPSPLDAYERIKDRDMGLGICVDLAHIVRSQENPVDQLIKVRERILDVHIRDVTEASKAGHSTRPGQGVLDFEAVLETLIDLDYAGYLSIEYEAEKDNPIPGHTETKGYIQGILKALA